MKRIILIANGPSSENITVRGWRDTEGKVFRLNHWTLNRGGSMGFRCDDWFIGEHNESWLPVVAAKTYANIESLWPQVWVPGLNFTKCTEIQKQIKPWSLRVQKEYQHLPPHCRWDKDPAPMRPTTGSLALAVAVGMQPEQLYIAGMDLYQHPAGDYGSGVKPPDFTDEFKDAYLNGLHGNHCLVADLRYIRAALSAYKGHVVCVGSVMKQKFGMQFQEWEWIDG